MPKSITPTPSTKTIVIVRSVYLCQFIEKRTTYYFVTLRDSEAYAKGVTILEERQEIFEINR